MSRHLRPSAVVLGITACLILRGGEALAAPVITANKDDGLAAGLRKMPGTGTPAENTITYTTTISNTGDATATAVQLTDPDPANTTFVSIQTTPLARHDAFNAIGNVPISIPAATGLLLNDNDADAVGPALTVTAVNTAGTQGNVTFNADGSFTFNPTAGFEGTTTFAYTMSDGEGNTDTATVTVAVSGMIWFVNSTGAAGDGRQATPFNSLAAFQAVNNGTGNNPAANDNIFLFENTTAYTGPVTLLNGQKLIGQDTAATLASAAGVTVPAGSTLPVTNSGNATTVSLTTSAAATNAINLTSGGTNTVRGLSIGNKTGSGIASAATFGTLTISEVGITGTGQALLLSGGALTAAFDTLSSTSGTNSIALTNVSGSLTVANAASALSGASGAEVLISGSTAAVSFPGTITNTAGRAIDIQNKTGGTVAFSGLVNDSGAGIFLNNNTGAAVGFTGGLTSSTGGNPAFTATGGGTVSLTGSSNTITTTTGTALTVANTTIGASGLNFRSITTNGAANGIVLNTTGVLGGLTVTGTGTTDGSGGTIQNTPGRGANLISTSNVSLSNMAFTSAGTSDLDGDNSGLSTGDNLASNAAIHLQSVTTVLLDNVDIIGGAEQGINGNTVANFTLNNSTIRDAGNEPDEDGIHFFNMSGTCAITNTTINCTVATPNTTGGDDHLNLQTNAGNLDLVISGGGATNANKGSGYLFGIRGTTVANITFGAANSANNYSGGIVADAFDTATMNLRVNASTSSGNNDQLSVSAGDSSLVDLEATGNTLSSPNAGDFVAVNLLGSALDNGFVFDARLSNNTISVGNGRTADGVVVFNAGGGVMNTAITNNTINYGGTQRGIYIQTGQDGAGLIRATVTGNNIDISNATSTNGVLVQSAVTHPSGAGATVDLNLGGTAAALKNTFTHSGGATLAGGDIRLRQRFAGNFSLDGYVGTIFDNAAVVTYLSGRNTVVSPSTATSDSTGGLGGGDDAVGPGFTNSTSPAFVTVAVSPASVLEDGAPNLTYTLTRSGSTAASLVAGFVMTGTASSASDYTVTGATSFNTGTGVGSVTFTAGSATASLIVDPAADANAAEFDESVVVDLGNGSFARGMITDDSPLLFAAGGVDPPAQPLPDAAALPQVAATNTNLPAPVAPLSQTELNFLVAASLDRWTATGLNPKQQSALRALQFEVADLPGLYLGQAGGALVLLDSDAGGHGWFTDLTPLEDSEFPLALAPTHFSTTPESVPSGRIDLLTTILHEMGHAIGLCDSYAGTDRDLLMYGFLTKGERRLPSQADAIAARFRGGVAHNHPHFLATPLSIGDLAPGKTVTVTYVVTINAGTTAVSTSSQGSITGGGGFPSPTLTNDPQTGAAADATVTPIHQPPTLTNLARSVAEDAVLTFSAVDFTGSYTDANTDALTTVRITSLPANGVLKNGLTTIASVPTDIAIGSIPNLTYTPNPQFNGSNNFGWNASDGTLFAVAGASVNLTVTEINDPPTAVADTLATVAEDAPAIVLAASVLTANDSAGPANESTQTLTVTAVSSPVGGTVALNAGNITFTLTPDFNGPASFAYTVSDNGTTNGAPAVLTASSTASFTVTEVNDPPVAADDTRAAVNEDAPAFAITVASLISNDSKGPANENAQALSVTAVGNVIGGTALLGGGNVTFTPAANFNGTAGFEYTLSDNGTTNGAAAPATDTGLMSFTITSVNDNPVAGADTISRYPTQSVKVSKATLLLNDTDPDGGTPAFVSVAATSANGGTVTSDGTTVFYTPMAGFTGADSFTYTINDGQTGTATGTVNVALITDLSPASNVTKIQKVGDVVTISFAGIPGRTYTVQSSENLTIWNNRGTVTADAQGKFQFVDGPTPIPPAVRYYRTVQP